MLEKLKFFPEIFNLSIKNLISLFDKIALQRARGVWGKSNPLIFRSQQIDSGELKIKKSYFLTNSFKFFIFLSADTPEYFFF